VQPERHGSSCIMRHMMGKKKKKKKEQIDSGCLSHNISTSMKKGLLFLKHAARRERKGKREGEEVEPEGSRGGGKRNSVHHS